MNHALCTMNYALLRQWEFNYIVSFANIGAVP